MKKSIFITLLAVLLMGTFNACNNSSPRRSPVESESAKKSIYTCTMHPEVRSDKPGQCPKCGMDLVLMETADTTNQATPSDTTQSH